MGLTPLHSHQMDLQRRWRFSTGILNADDYALIDSAAGAGGATDYYRGDFNYSDSTNSDDYFLIEQGIFGQGGVLPMSCAARSGITTGNATFPPSSAPSPPGQSRIQRKRKGMADVSPCPCEVTHSS